LYVLLAPNIDLAPRLTWHDGQRIAQLVLIGFVVILCLAVSRAGNAVSRIWAAISLWTRVAMYSAFALGLISALRAQLWRWAILEWAMLLLLLVVTLGVATGRRAGGTCVDRLLVVMVAMTATAYAAKVVIVYVAMLTVGAGHGMVFNVHELFTGFSNIRFFGHVQTMLLPFLLLPAMWWATTIRRRLLLGIVPALWWMLVAASGTRGTWVALFLGALTALLFGGRTGRRWIRWQIAGLVCGLLCYAVFVLLVPQLLEQPTSFLHRSNDLTSLSSREVIWAAALEFTKDNPILGVGPMHFAYYANAVAAHPHNAILQFMAEWGVPAALLITVVIAHSGLTFAGWVRRNTAGLDEQTRMTAIALQAALVGAAAQAMVDGLLVMPVGQILLTLISGWALGLYLACAKKIVPCGHLEKAFGTVLIVLAAAGVIHGVQPEIGRLEQREAAYMADHPGVLLLPRFWAQGWIKQ
jgi:O-antigen ligase